MFRETLDFYARAYTLATNEEERNKIRPYLVAVTKPKKPISKPESYVPMDEQIIQQQKSNIARAIDIMCDTLSEQMVVDVLSYKELDFCLLQEITHAGWTVTDEKGKVVLSAYLP